MGDELKFNPARYSDVYNRKFNKKKLGEALLAFLQTPENLLRMEVAVELKKPSAEAIAVPLLKEFGEEVKSNKVKQMIGAMIKKIMEHNGFALDAVGVRCCSERLFKSGARYRKEYRDI